MKKILYAAFAAIIFGCTPKINDLATNVPVNATIDLVNVVDDKVKVEIDPGRFTSESINFYIPKTVPGTYSEDNYGQYIEDLVALDYNGDKLEATKVDENTWKINNAVNLDKVIYHANDTFDTEKEKEEPVFSPAGTNIEAGKNYFLNLHMLVGYFDDLGQRPYQLSFIRPENMVASTSLVQSTNVQNPATKKLLKEHPAVDVFLANRYFEVTDNPIMYSELDSETFKVSDIEVTLSVYSPNNVYTANDIKADMERMMKAQKAFLGDVDSTKKYHILLYLSTIDKDDATGFGALEHHTSTTVVLPETMPKDALIETMIDVVSHEFFHIVTPLSVHSEDVHYFNYNAPVMSKHLWMYEGVTEYFANLFQVNQGLITEDEFFGRIVEKITVAKGYDDQMSFTVMSENILDEPYKENYINVYYKGALIGMCIDLIIREKSNGEKGILWLMKQLSAKYGQDNPFEDDKIIDEITALTYPEVGEFFEKHVIGDTPINYEEFLNKVGLKFDTETVNTGYFLHGQIPYIDANPAKNELFFRETQFNSFLTDLKVQPGDIIKSVNGKEFGLENARDLIMSSMSWSPEDTITMVVNRDGEDVTLTAKAGTPSMKREIIVKEENTTDAEKSLQNSWLKK